MILPADEKSKGRCSIKKISMRCFLSGEKQPRILYALLLPAAAALFGCFWGSADALFSRNLNAAALLRIGAGVTPALLQSLLLACLVLLTAFQIVKIISVFRRRAALVFAAALVFSGLSLFFPSDSAPAVAWLINLVFLLFATQAALQLMQMPPECMYRGVGLGMLLFLLMIGAFVFLSRWEASAPLPGTAWLAYWILTTAALALHILCVRKQRNFRLLEITLDDSSMTDSLKLALGSKGIRQLLPYIGRQMREGTSVAKLLLLEMMRGVEFDAKEGLTKAAFDSGPLEVRLAIVDQIFGWNLPYDLLPYVVDRSNASLAEYLIRMLFLNFTDIISHGVLDALRQRSDALSRHVQAEETGRMFDYVFRDKREGYAQILGGLLRSDRKEDRLFACEIMAGFIGWEDEANREYLEEVIESTALNPAELEEMIEMCAEYDDGLHYLKKDLSNYYDYAFLKKICRHYEPTSIVKAFGQSPYPIPMALVLLAACRLEKGGADVYGAKAVQLMAYLMRLRDEEARIRSSELHARALLLGEIQSLKLTLTAAALDYFQLVEAATKAEDMHAELKSALASGGTDRLLAELSGETAAALGELLAEVRPAQGKADCGALKVSENNALLESIDRYSGGEVMDTKLTDNIEKLITLKSIPMFGELDVFTLQQIQKISIYKKSSSGQTIITEGDEGTSLFIVISGRVGIYKSEKLINEIGAGGLLGEMAIIEKQRRSATVKTLAETSFLIIEGDDFVRLLERNSSISGSVIKTLAGRIRKMLEAGQ